MTECRKIPAHPAHRYLTDHGRTVADCEGRSYALLLAFDVILDNAEFVGDGQTCACHDLVWNFRDLKGGLCPFAA